jgi:hypothetical protein
MLRGNPHEFTEEGESEVEKVMVSTQFLQQAAESDVVNSAIE